MTQGWVGFSLDSSGKDPVGGGLRTEGFSLVELMIVMAIVAVAFLIGAPMVSQYVDSSRNLEARAQIIQMAKTLKDWEKAKGSLPATLAEVQLERNDPWGNAYRYLNVRTASPGAVRKDKSAAPINSDFDLYSLGKDGRTHLQLNQPTARDDIVRARDGAFIGVAEEFDP